MFMDVFDSLPISAYIGKKYLAVHGGISPKLTKIE
jgi:diadenosine tetraphosphatase ApaH/serine/threonine PP2A family protein phosphatase